jgi:hypothetical protein
MNNHLIKQLQAGEIAVHNDGTLEELREVLKYAFPKDGWYVHGATKYYKSNGGTQWISIDKTDFPSYSVKEFLKEETMEKKIIGYKLTKPEYEKAANQITGTENLILYSQNYNFQIDNHFSTFQLKYFFHLYQKHQHHLFSSSLQEFSS